MPRRYGTRHRRARPTRKGGRNTRAAKVTIPGQIVPARTLVSLPYTVYGSYTSATSALYPWQTSLFDPYQGVGGHQPLGSDEWNNFYWYYRVYGITGTVKVINMSATDNLLAYTYSSVTATGTGAPGQYEQPGKGAATVVTSLTGGNNIKTLQMSCKPAQTLGMTKTEYASSPNTYGSLGISNPATMAFVLLYVESMAGASVNLQYMFDLVFHCELWGCKVLAPS